MTSTYEVRIQATFEKVVAWSYTTKSIATVIYNHYVGMAGIDAVSLARVSDDGACTPIAEWGRLKISLD